MATEVLYQQVSIDNKFYIATRKKSLPVKQQVLYLMASVQYLKTSFICGNNFYVKKF